MALLKHIKDISETTQFLETIFENMSDAILVLDRDGYVVAANPAIEKMTGYKSDELIGQIHLCQICVGVATCAAEKSCVECFTFRSTAPSFEMKIRTKEGLEVPVAASSTRLPEQAAGALVIIMRDMSEQHRVERERFQRMMSNRTIQAQEEERKRVSRDLHDGVGQALYSIMIGLKILHNQSLNEDVKQYIDDVEQMTVRALEEVKNLAVELRPSALDDLGLVPAIRSFAKRFEDTFGIEVSIQTEGKKRRYSSAVETAVYRICQEAMTNAVKYADTDKISIHLFDRNNQLELEIQDYGKGFDLKHIEVQGTGLGLYGMQERADLVGGNVTIHSSIGHGTIVQTVIPLEEGNLVQ